LIGERQTGIDEDLSSLVGEVREGVTLVQNLVQVLRSPRVGPRQLSRALPELASACEQAIGPLSRLAASSMDVLSKDTSAVGALSELSARAIACLRAVSTRLADTSDRLGARRRLEIDALAASAVKELTALCSLGELVSYLAAPRPGDVDLADVAGVGLDSPQLERTVRADVRMLTLFLDVASREVSGTALEGAVDKGMVSLQRGANRRPLLLMRGGSAPASGASAVIHEVLTAVARRSGHEWTLTDAGGTLKL